MLKKILLSIGWLFGFLSFAVFANHCPLPSQVHYVGRGGWMAPYYEGFTEGPYHGEKVATSFKQVEWGRQDGVNSGPGTTLCFYLASSPDNNVPPTLIMMAQNNWGGVQKPKNSNWHWGYSIPVSKHEALKRVLICSGSVQNCQFHGR